MKKFKIGVVLTLCTIALSMATSSFCLWENTAVSDSAIVRVGELASAAPTSTPLLKEAISGAAASQTAPPEQTPQPTPSALPEQTPQPILSALPEQTPQPTPSVLPEQTPPMQSAVQPVGPKATPTLQSFAQATGTTGAFARTLGYVCAASVAI